ncbi:MAG: DsbA family protein [Flectobacillus sp.]|uniref:DsbA family protein n=1 Tax=Flectobacillus sp. TaxID=50419 RepID=UPI003B997485
MKVVIIGGGVAGLSLGLLLNKQNIEVTINEKMTEFHTRGHAFLMHLDGWSILEELSEGKKMALPGIEIGEFNFNKSTGEPIKRQKLNLWRCIKRKDLIAFLNQLVPEGIIKTGRVFSHFIYENNKAIAAQFTNGEIEYGDIFVGADGSNSAVRNQLFEPVEFTKVEVKEVVGLCQNTALTTKLPNVFTKFQSDTRGISFGMIPVSASDFVWFMQYNSLEADCGENASPEQLKAFCDFQLSDFPPIVNELLASNDFSTSYIWNTRDFGLLPTFHDRNVVLIGDAAHLALPFTSAGTTNAILDAKILSDLILKIGKSELAFEQYYAARKDEISKHIYLGRELKELFMHPEKIDGDKMVVPLISKKESDVQTNKPLKVQYFTDPVCSTCWVVQPMLRRLKLEYGEYFEIDYRMGGLLPSWTDYQRGPITQPSDVASHWEEVCMIHGIPLDGDIWLEDPLPSSYPPSIAFKAAQMQDGDLAILFLRRIKEMLFLEKKNIVDLSYLEKAAFEVGLDSAKFIKDYETKAQEAFRNDLVLAQNMEVDMFPTLIFTNQDNKTIIAKGYQEYDYFENIIHELIPEAKKRKMNTDPIFLFSCFSTMTNKEFSFLSEKSIEDTEKTLENLYERGYIDKFESKNGIIWKSKLADY